MYCSNYTYHVCWYLITRYTAYLGKPRAPFHEWWLPKNNCMSSGHIFHQIIKSFIMIGYMMLQIYCSNCIYIMHLVCPRKVYRRLGRNSVSIFTNDFLTYCWIFLHMPRQYIWIVKCQIVYCDNFVLQWAKQNVNEIWKKKLEKMDPWATLSIEYC